jgi:hypothetical protein
MVYYDFYFPGTVGIWVLVFVEEILERRLCMLGGKMHQC